MTAAPLQTPLTAPGSRGSEVAAADGARKARGAAVDLRFEGES
jgi:hypothetical protein